MHEQPSRTSVSDKCVVTALRVVNKANSILAGKESSSKGLGIGFVNAISEEVRVSHLYGWAKMIDKDESHDIALLKLTLLETIPNTARPVAFSTRRPYDGEEPHYLDTPLEWCQSRTLALSRVLGISRKLT
jgi:hypothetical protein